MRRAVNVDESKRLRQGTCPNARRKLVPLKFGCPITAQPDTGSGRAAHAKEASAEKKGEDVEDVEFKEAGAKQ
ncbi:protein of unknown function (plasmid) [Cupriavidus taiwanensis]|uniref:Uncharacterized protein n=1 Tax=Cupriavidus taiwanensis TaxID=164546 RepID=A0A9Q7UTI3_9BURK|nr:protein of unknown function [Cupriavidus taiwanensis]